MLHSLSTSFAPLNALVGFQALRSRMQRVCKCHGVSGSCSIRVCWRRLPPMRTVSEALGNMYDGASYVKVTAPRATPVVPDNPLRAFQLIERDGRPSKLRRRDPDFKKLIKSDMVYLEDSPDYCERNDE